MHTTYKPGAARYVVVQYRRGAFDAVMAGMGRHRGTWDADHSRSAAYRHAAELRAEPWRKLASLSYRVEPQS